MTYSRFGNTDNKFGFSRNSKFAGVKSINQRDILFNDELKNQIIKAQKEETRREIILALASA